jgi:hypothetical protein
MINEIKLTNYRRFEDHRVPFKPMTVVVGKNNAGKSTLVEAIRLSSLVANRATTLRYMPPPEWLEDAAGPQGVVPSLRDLNANLRNVFHAFNDPPALVQIRFATGASIDTYIGRNEHVFAVVRDSRGRFVHSKSLALRAGIPYIAVQPQVAPLQQEERLLDPQTVSRGMDSPLASAHFRNQLAMLGSAAIDRLRDLVDETWPSVRIMDLDVPTDNSPILLFVRDGKHVGEVAAMGHGLQMWLQVMWFLARNADAPTLVLDEPDVYMHADLQRKLMRLLRRSGQQIIVATHSVEIMSEVEPSDVLVVTSDRPTSRWASGAKGVQKVIDQIGGVHNVHLARLSQTRRCLFVEGDDLEYLRRMHDLRFPGGEGLGAIPRLQVGGWTGWQKVTGVAQFLRNSAGDLISSYCLFDSDFHLPEEVLQRYEEASRLSIRLHILCRKEIENYLLLPRAIAAVVRSKTRRRVGDDLEDLVEETVERVCSELIDETVEGYATEYAQRNRGSTTGTAVRWARKYVGARAGEEGGLISVVPGKRALSAVSAWSEATYGVTFGPLSVAQRLEGSDLSPELDAVLSAIRNGRATPEPDTWNRRLAL